MQVKKVIAFIAMVFFPLVQLAMSVARLYPGRLYPGLERWERDYAQIVYWIITMLGGVGFSTGARTRIKRISLDGACGMIVGSCCWLMSSVWFLNWANVYVIRTLDVIANFAALYYFWSLYGCYFMKTKEPASMV